MTEVISVRFRGGCKNYYFDPKGIQARMGDEVIVETAQGMEFATVTQGNHDVEDSAIVKPLSPVIRMATEAGNVIPPTALTTAPQIGLCGEVSASIPIHCVNRCADSPGKT